MFSKKGFLKEYILRVFNKLKTGLKDNGLSKRMLILNYAAPAVMVAVLVFTVAYWSNVNVGITVKYDGETMAKIENEKVLERANEILNSQRAVPDEDTTVPLSYEIDIMSPSENGSAFSVYSKLVGMNGKLAGDAVGLYIDGSFVGAAENAAEIKALLDGNIENIKLENKDAESAQYVNEIRYATGVYPTDSVYSSEELVQKAEKLLSVSVNKLERETQAIKFAVVYEEDPSHYEGYKAVKTNGSDGVKTLTYDCSYVDGKLTDKELVSEAVTTAATNEIIVVGTMELPYKGVGSGTFMWPVPYTTNVTSEYGRRWGKLHKGIDISAGGCYGQTIVAADGGVVTWAGYDDSGYGYHVIIDHGNGMSTLYAHCSELYVSSGEEVGKGQSIGAIGCSGNVTGEHLHFEIYVGDSPVDPRNYL